MFITDVSVGIISSIIYDVLKKIGTQKDEYSLNNEVRWAMEETLQEVEYSGLVAFVQAETTYSYIFNYIKLSAFSTFLENNRELKIPLEEFIKRLVTQTNDFIKNNNYNQIDDNYMYDFYRRIMGLIQNNIITNLPDELLAIPMLINNIVEQLEDVISQTGASSESNPKQDYEEIKLKYINILREALKVNFVPGVDRLEFSEFYIYPRFSYSFKSRSINSKVFHNEHEAEYEINWENIFNVSNLVSIIGGPGYGKTLFMKNLVLSFKKLNIDNRAMLLPIYCNLKEYVESKKSSRNYSMEDFLLESMINYTGLDSSSIDKKFIRNYLDTGNCLILLDALDEVELSERERLSNLIVSFFETSHKNNKICITTRDRSLIPNTPVVLKVNNINEVEIEEYLNFMVKINEFDQKDIPSFKQQCLPLLREGFLTNFLTVALMVNIYKAYRKLPENKVELYDKCASYISKEREKDKKVKFDFGLMNTIVDNDVTFENLANLGKRNNKEVKRQDIVENLTMTFQKRYSDQNQASYAVNHFLDYCQERTELYVHGTKENYFKFFHRSFFEYFYAKHIVKNTRGDVAIYNELLKFNFDSEVPELLLAFVKSTHYPRYLKLVDIVLKKSTTVNNTERAYQLAFEFVYLSDEHDHLEYFYKYFFETNQRLKLFNSAYSSLDKLQDILTRFLKFDNYFEVLKSSYFEELVTVLIHYAISEKYKDKIMFYYDNIKFTFIIIFKEIYKIYQIQILELMDSITLEQFSDTLERCSAHRKFYEEKIKTEELDLEIDVQNTYSINDFKTYYKEFKGSELKFE